MTKTNEDTKDFGKKILGMKKVKESYVVLSLYKDIDLMIQSGLKVDAFGTKVWKFYFSLLERAVRKGIRKADSVVIGALVDEIGGDTKAKYDEFGGFDTIEDGIEMVQVENLDGYVLELSKTNVIINLVKAGFPINTVQELDSLMAMEVSAIQTAFELKVANCFSGLDSGEKVEDLSDGLWDMVEEANKGIFKGYPYASKLLNHYTNGMSLGNITMLSANSGVGKTFITVGEVLPSFIQNELGKKKLTIMANEEDSRKWKQAIVVWVANNVFKGEFEKQRFNTGGFTKDELTLLKQSVEWLNNAMEKGQIEFVGFNNFSMAKAIAIIKKQAKTKGTEYFILDTLKMDSTSRESEQVWLQLQSNMVHLYDAIKSQTNNVHVFVTYQLGKSAMQRAYLDQSALGVSRNVVDVVSTLLIARKAFDSEKRVAGTNEGGLQVREHGMEGVIKYMDSEKDYFIIFPAKNRFGTTNEQMVFEVDMALNVIKDFGYVRIQQDF